MNGAINANVEAVLRIDLYGRGKRRERILAVIDTGFSGALTLPGAIIRRLRMPYVGTSQAELADGSRVDFHVYMGFVEWDGKLLPVHIDESESTPLVGMELLEGHRLKADIWDGGAVSITRARRKRR